MVRVARDRGKGRARPWRRPLRRPQLRRREAHVTRRWRRRRLVVLLLVLLVLLVLLLVGRLVILLMGGMVLLRGRVLRRRHEVRDVQHHVLRLLRRIHWLHAPLQQCSDRPGQRDDMHKARQWVGIAHNRQSCHTMTCILSSMLREV